MTRNAVVDTADAAPFYLCPLPPRIAHDCPRDCVWDCGERGHQRMRSGRCAMCAGTDLPADDDRRGWRTDLLPDGLIRLVPVIGGSSAAEAAAAVTTSGALSVAVLDWDACSRFFDEPVFADAVEAVGAVVFPEGRLDLSNGLQGACWRLLRSRSFPSRADW